MVTALLADQGHREEQCDEDDRHAHPEQRSPIADAEQDATDDRASHQAGADDRTNDAERAPAFVVRERLRHDGVAIRHHHCDPDGL